MKKLISFILRNKIFLLLFLILVNALYIKSKGVPFIPAFLSSLAVFLLIGLIAITIMLIEDTFDIIRKSSSFFNRIKTRLNNWLTLNNTSFIIVVVLILASVCVCNLAVYLLAAHPV